LQIDILGCLALRGKLTKGMTESLLPHRRHGDILDDFNKLEKNMFIKKMKERKFGRGRAQFYYKITENGLYLLINCEPIHPSRFWKAMFGYCYYNNSNMSSIIFQELYQAFISKYLKYPDNRFFFQLDIFTETRDKWLNDFILNNDNNKISSAQKVIECLALHPKLKFEELVEKTQEDEAEISKVLLTHTLESYSPLVDKTYYMYQSITGQKYNKKYQDFLLHSTILVKQNNKGVNTYELSLFGVMLSLTLVRYYDMNKLKLGLYYTNISFPNYYDKIASNYEDKLPLIFGKWKLLKDILRLFSAYNFDIVLDKDLRLRDYDKVSIIRGGNNELYDGIREIIFQTRQQLGDFAKAGRNVWPEHIPGLPYVYEVQENNDGDYLMKNNFEFQDRPDLHRVDIIKKKLIEIMILLNPLEYGFSELASLPPEAIREISCRFEELFANEITALYYFHLYYDYGFETRINKSASYYYSSSINKDDKFPTLLPKSCLKLILQNDKEKPLISEWYNGWMKDISSLQKEIYEMLYQ
jgi:predicted transcriptional regulator